MSKKINLREYLYAALFAALISVLAYVVIPLPFTPIQITGQTLGVMLAGSILTTRQTAISISTFLLLGIVGVPVFSGGRSGIGVIAGPSGGYLIGFLVGAIVISLLKGKSNNLFRLSIANIVGGVIIIYTFGVIWLSIERGIGIPEAIFIGAVPFLPGDIIKVIIATLSSFSINKQLSHLVRP